MKQTGCLTPPMTKLELYEQIEQALKVSGSAEPAGSLFCILSRSKEPAVTMSLIVEAVYADAYHRFADCLEEWTNERLSDLRRNAELTKRLVTMETREDSDEQT